MRRVEACLNEVLAFGLGDERLELRGCGGVDEAAHGRDRGALDGENVVEGIAARRENKWVKEGRKDNVRRGSDKR